MLGDFSTEREQDVRYLEEGEGGGAVPYKKEGDAHQKF